MFLLNKCFLLDLRLFQDNGLSLNILAGWGSWTEKALKKSWQPIGLCLSGTFPRHQPRELPPTSCSDFISLFVCSVICLSVHGYTCWFVCSLLVNWYVQCNIQLIIWEFNNNYYHYWFIFTSCFFIYTSMYYLWHSHQLNHQNVSLERKLVLSSGFCFCIERKKQDK